jgi:hypothetical protein
MTTLKQIEKVLKEVLLSKPKTKAKYENKKPTKVEKNQPLLIQTSILQTKPQPPQTAPQQKP